MCRCATLPLCHAASVPMCLCATMQLCNCSPNRIMKAVIRSYFIKELLLTIVLVHGKDVVVAQGKWLGRASVVGKHDGVVGWAVSQAQGVPNFVHLKLGSWSVDIDTELSSKLKSSFELILSITWLQMIRSLPSKLVHALQCHGYYNIWLLQYQAQTALSDWSIPQ